LSESERKDRRAGKVASHGPSGYSNHRAISVRYRAYRIAPTRQIVELRFRYFGGATEPL
jgi:hypothetical protein